jgi:hypothetical protein
MLQTIEEIKKVEMNPGMIINGVDNANLLSVDSTTPIVTDADAVKPEDQSKEELLKVAEPVKEEVKVEVKVPETKVEDKKEEKKEDKKEAALSDEDKDPVEKRIGKLTKKWRTTERERDYERNKRIEAETELAKVKATIPSVDKPKKVDYEDEESFIEALTEWKVDEKLKTQQVESAKKSSEETAKQTGDEVEKELNEITRKGRDKFDDYDTLVFDKDLVLTQNMIETILLSDIAEDLLYYLGKNPDESAAIGEMPMLKAAKEIGKLELKLGTAVKEVKTEEKPVPVKKLTNTPEPIVPLKTDGVVDKDPSQMSPKEYRAWREKNKE